MNNHITGLTVFYDPDCGLCRRFRLWLSRQPLAVRVEFIGFNAPEAEEKLPGIRHMSPDKEVIVLADDGRWWQGAESWLVCLWATRTYRHWSWRLARPAFRPVLLQAVQMISANRLKLSRLMRLRSDRDLAAELAGESLDCGETGTCHTTAWRTNLTKGGLG